jgi:hypothetical protein
MILGTVQAVDNTSGLSILLDSETEATTKDYKYLASYVPAVGDRVLIEQISGTYVIIGKIISTKANAGQAAHATSATTATTANSVNNNYGSNAADIYFRTTTASASTATLQYRYGTSGAWKNV